MTMQNPLMPPPYQPQQLTQSTDQMQVIRAPSNSAGWHTVFRSKACGAMVITLGFIVVCLNMLQLVLYDGASLGLVAFQGLFTGTMYITTGSLVMAVTHVRSSSLIVSSFVMTLIMCLFGGTNAFTASVRVHAETYQYFEVDKGVVAIHVFIILAALSGFLLNTYIAINLFKLLGQVPDMNKGLIHQTTVPEHQTGFNMHPMTPDRGQDNAGNSGPSEASMDILRN